MLPRLSLLLQQTLPLHWEPQPPPQLPPPLLLTLASGVPTPVSPWALDAPTASLLDPNSSSLNPNLTPGLTFCSFPSPFLSCPQSLSPGPPYLTLPHSPEAHARPQPFSFGTSVPFSGLWSLLQAYPTPSLPIPSQPLIRRPAQRPSAVPGPAWHSLFLGIYLGTSQPQLSPHSQAPGPLPSARPLPLFRP